MNLFTFREAISKSKLIVLVTVFLTIFGNYAFFKNVITVYPVNQDNIPFLISLTLLVSSVLAAILGVACNGILTKPLLIVVLIISSITAYFMDSFNLVIDDIMIQNIFETNLKESIDIVSIKLTFYFTLLGVYPSIIIYRIKLMDAGVKANIISNLKLFGIAMTLAILCMVSLGSTYATFFREHKSLRYYSNPAYWIYSTVKYVKASMKPEVTTLKSIGRDAKIPTSDVDRELIIFVLGETARSDRFSLNGYARQTNPFLEKIDLISFTNFWSCGTSTSVSVPCIFAKIDNGHYSSQKAKNSENLLDVLSLSGVNVFWLDNNSDSKGVAIRSNYYDYSTNANNPVCDVECRDVGMLSNLQKKIDSVKEGDIFIVLHQMGSHGPAYYKRYPSAFKRFSPTCESNQLQSCNDNEISNTYDNAILYTDYFLSKTIELLKRNDRNFETAMFYVSDHGESLGERGIYLHGMPNMIAPDAQRHVPAIMWFGANFDGIHLDELKLKSSRELNHENVFHTLLGMMEVETDVYDPALDILHAP